MKYIVKLDWRNTYEFDDANTAINFAGVAVTHRTEEDSEVTITVVEEEREES